MTIINWRNEIGKPKVTNDSKFPFPKQNRVLRKIDKMPMVLEDWTGKKACLQGRGVKRLSRTQIGTEFVWGRTLHRFLSLCAVLL